jgi:hypothetical protein
MSSNEILKRTEEGMKEGRKVLIRELIRDLEEDTTKTTLSGVYSLTGNIILIHKKSAKVRTYEAGNGRRWFSDFRLDLKNKLFG